jgi:TolB-like protein/Tfp pilus assembly protein PilF
LDNLSGDPEQEYFADGMTETLIAELAQISALKVISRTSAMRYKDTDKSLPDIARELNVDGVLEGSVMRAEDRVRITAQLIQGSTDQHIWARSFERELRDVLSLQSEVARAIADEIKIQLTPQEETVLTRARPVNPEAHEAYLRGLYQLNNEVISISALEFFQRATEIDPDYALAYSGLANAYVWLANVGKPAEIMPKAKAAASRALELDDTLADAHRSMGEVLMLYDWDWPAAEREFKRAIELNPGHAGAHVSYGIYLSNLGRRGEGVAELRRALELDPLSPIVNILLADYLRSLGQFDESIKLLERVLEWDPDNRLAYVFLSHAYHGAGMHEECFEAQKRVYELMGIDEAVEVAERASESLDYEGVWRELGRLMAELSRTRDDIGPNYIAGLYVRANEKDRAIQWWETAYEQHDPAMVWLLSPDNDPLRSEPRFQDLVRRMNFPQ